MLWLPDRRLSLMSHKYREQGFVVAYFQTILAAADMTMRCGSSGKTPEKRDYENIDSIARQLLILCLITQLVIEIHFIFQPKGN